MRKDQSAELYEFYDASILNMKNAGLQSELDDAESFTAKTLELTKPLPEKPNYSRDMKRFGTFQTSESSDADSHDNTYDNRF